MNDAVRIINEQIDAGGRVCITSSFQADGMVLLHLLRQRAPAIPVLFLDTFHHFPEVLAYRDAIAERWQLAVVTLSAASPQRGLWASDTTECCRRHKVEPLFTALEEYDVWFTALRRDQSPSRAALQEVEPFPLPSGRAITRVSPLARWSKADVAAYVKTHDIPLLPLYEDGYTSIGCEPCTSRPSDRLNERSGRWGGQKLECGIHLPVVAPAGSRR